MLPIQSTSKQVKIITSSNSMDLVDSLPPPNLAARLSRRISQKSNSLVRRLSKKNNPEVKGASGLFRSASEGTKRKTPSPSITTRVISTKEDRDNLDLWSTNLRVCWDDSRAALEPETQNYDSNSDFLPPHLRRVGARRLVYSSTLSSYPVRPPLKTRASSPLSEPVETAAQQIASEWRRNAGGTTVTPTSYSLDLELNYDGSITPTVSNVPTARMPITAKPKSESDPESLQSSFRQREESTTTVESVIRDEIVQLKVEDQVVEVESIKKGWVVFT